MPDVTMQTALAGTATTTGDVTVSNVATQFALAIQAGLETLLAEYDGTRMSSDFSIRDEQVPAGAAHFQIQAFTLPQTTVADANVDYFPAMLCRVLVHYHLGAGEAESHWTMYGMQNVLLALIDPQWWRDLDRAFFIDEDPVGSGVQRVGNVVSFTVTVTVTIRPPGE